MTKSVFVVEGLDRLGKDTLIEGIIGKCGFYQVVHFSKPKALPAYSSSTPVEGVGKGYEQLYHYQAESFRNGMIMAKSGARIIFNRSWIGEAVYAGMYRNTDGGYVFQQELNTGVAELASLRLILLWEDFEVAKHFVDDGESLGAIENRQEEQQRFFAAFERSNIQDKRKICVTDQGLGGFKPKEWILQEALA